MRLSTLIPMSFLFVAGCGGPLAATWIGDVTCQAVPFDLSFTLAKDKGKTYVGTGEQKREYTNTNGQRTSELIEFDIELTLDSNSGPQDLATSMVCTYEDKVIFRPGDTDGETVEQGCGPRRFEDWTISWDGEDELTVSDPNGCQGTLARR